MKRVIISAFVVAALLILAGCEKSFMPAGSEITAFEVIRVLGIDKSEDSGEIEVSVIAERAKPSPGEEGGGMSYEVMSEAAPTAFEAVSKLREKSDKKLALGHVDYIIFGEAAARDNLTKYADYPARSPEIRYSPRIFIARGAVKELLSDTSSGDKFIGDVLDNLRSGVRFRSDFALVRSIDLINMLDRKDMAAVIPLLETKEIEEELIDGEEPEKELSAAGYAIIRDFELAGFFEGTSARGYNFLTNNARTSTYSVPDGRGGYVALDVLSDGVKIAPRFDDRGELIGVTYTISVNAGIAEQSSRVNLQTDDGFSRLSNKLAAKIEGEAREAIAKSKELGIDCFDLGDKLRVRLPHTWREIKDNWRENYVNLNIDVKADAAVRRVYDLREPVGRMGNRNA